MATASSMIFRALMLNGEKSPGGTFTSAEGTVYLDAMNSMLESWGIDRLMLTNVLQESFALTSSTASYTIGSGGVFNTVRPVKLVDPCFVRDSANLDQSLELIGAEAYGNFVQKSTSGSYPAFLFYDSANVAGLGTIYLYPAPQAGLTLFINSWKSLPNYSTLTTSTLLAPGYQRAIEYNLCIEIAGGFKPVSAEVIKIAREAKAAIKTLNTPDALMRLDYGIAEATRQGRNIFTGG